MLVSCDIDFGRSWIILLNTIGATIDSWGIPMSIVLANEDQSPILAIIFHPDKTDIFIDISREPFFSSLNTGV